MEETKTELQLIKLSEIQSQEVSWLWFPFIPYGKLTIIQGDPGDGKMDLCQYFGQKKLKDYAAFLSSSSSFCCGVR